MQLPHGHPLIPLKLEFERTWGIRTSRTEDLMKWADQNGYAMSAYVIYLTHEINEVIVAFLRELRTNPELHRKYAE
jgi:hypothetical protein